ncbi:MAG: hypothetical protein LBN74_04830 [Prevotella sp.]|jgi:hypothetical protein|nr:hypothetical protein [Prevotella sp.]
MKNHLFYASILFFAVSCTSDRGVLISNIPKYKNKEGYKNFYFVDTIYIDNPIFVFSKNENEFVMSKSVYALYNGKEDFLLYRPDVFFVSDNLPMGGIPTKMFDQLILHSRHYCWEMESKDNLTWMKEKKKGISRCYTYKKQPEYFLLYLIRGDYYNQVYTGLDGPSVINFKRNKYNYYKIVIPVCK